MNSLILVLLPLALCCCTPLHGKHKSQRWNAKEYAQHSSPQYLNAIKEIPRLALTGTESVLDVGCGNGLLDARVLAQYLPNGSIHGIDASADQIQQAIKTYAKNNRLTFEQANVLTYKPTKLYDAVISFWVLHWVKDYEQALRTLYTALKPGGKALIGHLAERDLTLCQEAKKLLQQEPWRTYCKGYEFPIHTFPIERITQAARSVGFAINYVQLINETAHFKDSNQYAKHYQALPLAGCIPADQQAAFFNEAVSKALAQEKHNPDGSITANGYVVYLLLEKPKK